MPSKAKIIKRAITDAIMNMMTPPLVSVVGSLSDSSADKLSKAIAKVIRLFNIGAYKNIRANLNVAFPEMAEDGRRELAFRNAVHTVRFGIDFLRVLKHPEMVKACTIPPDESIREIVDKSAIILCLPHLGNWEIFGQAIPCFGFKAAAVAEMFPVSTTASSSSRAKARGGKSSAPCGRAIPSVSCRTRTSVRRTAASFWISSASQRRPARFRPCLRSGSTCPSSSAHPSEMQTANSNSTSSSCRKQRMNIRTANRLRRPSSRRTRRSSANFRNNICIRQFPEQYLWTYHRWRYIPSNATDDFAKRFPFYAVKRPYPCPEPLMAQGACNNDTPTTKG